MKAIIEYILSSPEEIIAVVCLNSAIRPCVLSDTACSVSCNSLCLSAITVLWFLLLWKASTCSSLPIWHPLSLPVPFVSTIGLIEMKEHLCGSKYELACCHCFTKSVKSIQVDRILSTFLSFFSGTNMGILSLCFRSVHLPIIGCHRWKAGTTDQ